MTTPARVDSVPARRVRPIALLRDLLPDRRPDAARVSRFAHGAAWFFLAYSLVAVAGVVVTKWGDPGGVTALFETVADGAIHRPLGLAYAGVAGVLLALVQLGVVGGATAATFASRRKTRRIGHVVLIAWAALWAAGVIRLAALDGRVETFAQAALLSGLAACTVHRAVRPGRTVRAAPAPDDEPRLTVLVGLDDTPPPAACEPPRTGAPDSGRIRRLARRVPDMLPSRAQVRSVTGRAASVAGRSAARVRTWLRRHAVLPRTTAAD